MLEDDDAVHLIADVPDAAIYGVAWSPDGMHLAAAGELADVSVWDVATSECLLVYPGTGHGAETVAWSPDSSRIA